MRPKKSFGQNFLQDDSISQRIVRAFRDRESTGRVLEVGPGRGALSNHLINEDFTFKAVEADKNLYSNLLETHGEQRDTWMQGDFLKMELDKVFEGQPFSIIGNFPYNISSQIVFHIEKYKEYIPLVVGMFQKELAERIVSKEGTKKYGTISVLIGAYYESSILFNVDKSSFYPVPKVTSSVIMMKRKADYELPCSPKMFRAVVKASFGQRRKMIRNSIKSLIIDKKVLDSEFMTRRPEQMSLQDYFTLTRMIENQKK